MDNLHEHTAAFSLFLYRISQDPARGSVLGPDVPQHGAGGPNGPGCPVPG